jgi:hypothetical protein
LIQKATVQTAADQQPGLAVVANGPALTQVVAVLNLLTLTMVGRGVFRLDRAKLRPNGSCD